MAGATYEMTHGETFIIWLLMVLVIKLPRTLKGIEISHTRSARFEMTNITKENHPRVVFQGQSNVSEVWSVKLAMALYHL